MARSTFLVATPEEITLVTSWRQPRTWQVGRDVSSYTIHTDLRHNMPPYLLVLLDDAGAPVASLPLRDWVPEGELLAHDLFIQPETRRRTGSRMPWPLDSLVAAAGLSPYRGDHLDDNAVDRAREQWAPPTPASTWVLVLGMLAPGIWLLTAILIGAVAVVLDARGLVDVAGVLALAFLGLACAVPLHQLNRLRRLARPRPAEGVPDGARVLRPVPGRAVSRQFSATSWLAVTGDGVVLHAPDGRELVFPSAGPTAVTRWTVARDGDRPTFLDLYAGRHHLTRLAWDDWFPDGSTEHLRQALGIIPQPSDTTADPATLPWRLDDSCSAGDTGLVLALPSLITCLVVALSVRLYSTPLAWTVGISCALTVLVVTGTHWLGWRVQRDREPTPQW
ncbi:MAG: hypothetical protein GXX79_15130 [Actinomycetales bacterium]|nr:hypothetical protein [Actinomycetales bacterium]